MGNTVLEDRLQDLADTDVTALWEAEKSYGDSWKQRGGVGAFMMLARKWDRLEKQVEEQKYDILTACVLDPREEGVLDDIRDLRRYLLLVENEANTLIDEHMKSLPGYVNQD